MILKLELLLKVLSVLLIGCFLLRSTAREQRKRFFPLLLAACGVGALAGWYVCSLVPNMTESVTINAEGVQNEHSSSRQVEVVGFFCDGAELPAAGAAGGAWLDEPEGTRWVGQEDERWFEGMTPSVSFQIPVGWERYVVFRTGPDYGVATVAFAGESQRIDAYAPEADTAAVLLPETPKLTLLQNSLLRCALFAVLAALCAAAPYACLLVMADGNSSVREKLHKYRFLFEELVHRDFTKKYKRTALGLAWSVLLPLLQLLVLYVVFSKIFASNIPHYVTYLFSGQLVYNYFVEATNQGMCSLLENAPIFTKVNLPKYLFVFSKNVSSLINFLLTLVVFFIFCWIDQITFTWRFILLLCPVICLVLFNIGFGMILSALNVFFRDTQYLYSIFTTILMWCSAIFYSVEQFSPTAQKNYLWNPVYVYIRYFRMITIEGVVPSIGYHLWAFGYAVLAVSVGFAIYKKYNHRFLYYV